MDKKTYEELKEIKTLSLATASLLRDILIELRRFKNGDIKRN